MKQAFFLAFFMLIQQEYRQSISIEYEINAHQAVQQLNEKIKNSLEPVDSGTILAKDAVELLDNFSYTLNINNSKSHFFLNPIMLPENENLTAVAMVKIMVEKGDYFQDMENNQVLKKKTSFGKKFIIESKMTDYNWELTSECKEINGYESYKAVTKLKDLDREGGYRDIDIVVWFTPQIPLSLGPEGYGGLPGLILEKCQGGICLTIKKIKSKENVITFPNGKRTDREEYYKILEEYRQKRKTN
ncbi:MAG TPA: GLPGLI family protein [Flavobacteriaceae bacterium]|nr:GLPGLI family protein [Flavobacteriaceae bacterium]